MATVRELMLGAMDGAERTMRRVVDEASKAAPTDAELVTEYLPMRGNVPVILEWTAQRVGPGAHTIREAARYEDRMERLLRAQQEVV